MIFRLCAISTLFFGPLLLSVVPDEPPLRPNVLFIAIDDLRPELGSYGSAHVISPNIDALASDGMLFERAYCQQAVCSPSRISVMTGLRPDSTRIYDNATHHRRTVPETVTLSQHFMQQGYHAVDFGKIYHGHMGAFNDVLSWSEPWYYPPSNFSENLRGYRSVENLAHLAANRRRPNGLINFSASATEGEDVPDNGYPDGMTVDTVVKALPRLASNGKPFFLAVGIEKPHLPFLAPKKYWDLYDRDSIRLPARQALPENAPAIAGMNWGELRGYSDMPKQGDMSEEKARELIHGYYACVSYADALIGQLIQGLKENGLYENTIIVLWGDHGWKLGDYGDWCKLTNYELDTRVPLIVRAPGRTSPGSRTDALVELVDLYPSLSELAGLPLPEHLQGSSFAGLIDNPAGAGKPAAFSQFPRGNDPEAGENGWESAFYMGYSMRTDRYRYTRWIERRSGDIVGEELYDHQRDPGETINVFTTPSYGALADSLAKAFQPALKAVHQQHTQ